MAVSETKASEEIVSHIPGAMVAQQIIEPIGKIMAGTKEIQGMAGFWQPTAHRESK